MWLHVRLLIHYTYDTKAFSRFGWFPFFCTAQVTQTYCETSSTCASGPVRLTRPRGRKCVAACGYDAKLEMFTQSPVRMATRMGIVGLFSTRSDKRTYRKWDVNCIDYKNTWCCVANLAPCGASVQCSGAISHGCYESSGYLGSSIQHLWFFTETQLEFINHDPMMCSYLHVTSIIYFSFCWTMHWSIHMAHDQTSFSWHVRSVSSEFVWHLGLKKHILQKTPLLHTLRENWVESKQFHWFIMVYHGLSMAYPWFIHGLSMWGDPMDVLSRSKVLWLIGPEASVCGDKSRVVGPRLWCPMVESEVLGLGISQ